MFDYEIVTLGGMELLEGGYEAKGILYKAYRDLDTGRWTVYGLKKAKVVISVDLETFAEVGEYLDLIEGLQPFRFRISRY